MLIYTAVSSLFNLPCIYTPLRFHSGDHNSRHFTGCGWIQKQQCSFFSCRSYKLIAQSSWLFQLKLHRQLFNMAVKQLTIYQCQRNKTNIAVESINTCTFCINGDLKRLGRLRATTLWAPFVVVVPWGELRGQNGFIWVRSVVQFEPQSTLEAQLKAEITLLDRERS